jgi:hypothetical protein
MAVWALSGLGWAHKKCGRLTKFYEYTGEFLEA